MKKKKNIKNSQCDFLGGLQFGDEGKGKVVDYLALHYAFIARCGGGCNAGHTVGGQVLHIIPSGIFNDKIMNLIGSGVVLDPSAFLKEFKTVEKLAYQVARRILISYEINLTLQTHKLLDQKAELLKGGGKIGTTGKGIGPTYRDKIGRSGIRIGYASDNWKSFQEKSKELFGQHLAQLKALGIKFNSQQKKELNVEMKEWYKAVKIIVKTFKIVKCSNFVNGALNKGQRILVEGAQAVLLDIDAGSYPFVTSSTTTSAGACTGLGIAPNRIGEIFGVFKAYCTRVGAGPFPTELGGNKSALWCAENSKEIEMEKYPIPDPNSENEFEQGVSLRRLGQEFGSTTGRPRRCGWLDLVALKYAIQINGVTQLTMTKLDVLDTLKQIKVAIKYKKNGKEIEYDPCLKDVEIEYKVFHGWLEDTSRIITVYKGLPLKARKFIKFVEEYVGVPINYISVGPARESLIDRLAEKSKRQKK